MKIGVSVPTVIGNPVNVAVLAEKAESLGFESIWIPELLATSKSGTLLLRRDQGEMAVL